MREGMLPEPQRPGAIVIDKIAAARREIDTAIWLWFKEGDIVSIYQLADSALGILDGLYHARGLPRPRPFDYNPIAESFGISQREARDAAKSTGAFGKHGREDPEDVHEYHQHPTMLHLHCAAVALGNLEESERHGLIALFCAFFGETFPYLFRPDSWEVSIEGFPVDNGRKFSRSEFFQQFGGDFVANPPWITR